MKNSLRAMVGSVALLWIAVGVQACAGGDGSTDEVVTEPAAGSAGTAGTAGKGGAAGKAGAAGTAGKGGEAGSSGGSSGSAGSSAGTGGSSGAGAGGAAGSSGAGAGGSSGAGAGGVAGAGAGGSAGTAGAAGEAGAAGQAGAAGAAGEAGAAGTAGAAGAPPEVCDEGTKDLDGIELTGKGGCEYKCPVFPAKQTDAIDNDFLDENCDGSDGVVEACVFVSASLGANDTADGTRNKPFATINAAIAFAKDQKFPAVCVSGEVYDEAVVMASGVSLYGGFDHQNSEFIFRRSKSVTTTIRAKGTVILAEKVDAETHVEGLTIIAQEPDASEADGSVYGIRLLDGTGELVVRWNSITAGNGRKGEDGADGEPLMSLVAPSGTKGGDGCETGSTGQCGLGAPAPSCEFPGGKGGDGGVSTGAGQNGSPSPDGTSGGPGAGGNSCSPFVESPGKAASPGEKGTDGTQGEPGQGGVKLGGVTSGRYQPGNGGDGKGGKNGKGGGGGGGGGGGSSSFPCDPDAGGGGGSGGCGGKGGNFGKGGTGGYGSFGIFVAGGSATVDQNKIKTGAGGDGGKGGNGVLGQTGGSGQPGGSHSDDSGPGGKGGDGGKGGSGGPGGGGGGGPSACVAFDLSKSNVSVKADGSCSTGTPGFGANGGSNPDGAVANKGENGQASEKVGFN